MALVYAFFFLLFLLPLMGGDGMGYQGECPPSFQCAGYLNISFPFTITERQDCGLLSIHNCHDPLKPKMIQLQNKWFQVIHLPQFPSDSASEFRDKHLYGLLQSRRCEAFKHNYTFPPTFHFASFPIKYNATLFRCNHTLHVNSTTYNYTCPDCHLYYTLLPTPDHAFTACTKVHLPIKDLPDSNDPFTFVTADILTEVKLTEECSNCHYNQRGQCRLDSRGRFVCANAKPKMSSWNARLIKGLGIGIPGILIIVLLILLLLYKRKHGGHIKSSNSYSDSSLNPCQESCGVCFEVPVFSYEELKEATNNFDHTKELGDGGFGTVYFGKLPDGREVAVKRLYEHNYRRVEQFMNEVKILTPLRHKNLVTLYGCTSRYSRELMLVYEYVSNGTVACHLHGGLAKPGTLPWSIRIKIAIETASALTYLHASDIIHRDVKSSNILLDSHFCVKVADFGLSKLFPLDVTHVSTTPQGTPGYVDPEYHQCYQLTSKSDVYSFGVVLIELISSKPAVDISRSKDEINLSNLAIKKIQENAIDELVDPFIGFDSDNEVKEMIVSVAELAFQCLQKDKESRPSMEEVLNELMRTQSRKERGELLDEAEVGLSKHMKISISPNNVTDKWESKCTTPNVTG